MSQRVVLSRADLCRSELPCKLSKRTFKNVIVSTLIRLIHLQLLIKLLNNTKRTRKEAIQIPSQHLDADQLSVTCTF